MNEKYVISTLFIMSKTTLMIHKISSVYGIQLGRRILDIILYIVGKSDIPL